MTQPFPICPCASCMAEWLEWAEITHDMDNLAARDPEPDARREFADFIASDPEQQRSVA